MVISDVYFDVAMILSKWRRHQIIKLSWKVLLLKIFLLVGFLTEFCLFMGRCKGIKMQTNLCVSTLLIFGQYSFY